MKRQILKSFLSVLLVGIFLFLAFGSGESDTTSSSSNGSSAPSESSPTSLSSCPKCGREYNKETWGEMCNVCWKNGEALKCEHGYPGKKTCPYCK